MLLTPREPAGAPSLRREATRRPDGTWKAARLEIGQPGVWIVTLTVNTGSGEPFILDAPIMIDQ